METDKKAEEIINNHVNFSMIAGAIPIPVIDFITITGIQLDMIKQLSEVFSVDYDDNKGKNIADVAVLKRYERLRRNENLKMMTVMERIGK